MKKTIKNYLIAALVTILLMSAIGVSYALSSSKNQVKAYEINCELKTKYVLGEELIIPDAIIEFDGQNLDAEFEYIVFPNGKAYKNQTVNLTEEGRYEIFYSAISSGKKIVSSKSVDVLGELFSVSNPESKISYGAHQYTPNTNGLMVKIEKGDFFTYNRPIDVTNFTAMDKIVKFYITPNTIGVCDASQVRIRLTDAYDDGNYVEMLLKSASHIGSWADIAAYLNGNASFQRPTGIYNGEPRSDWGGTEELFTLCGKPLGDVPLDEDQFTFAINYKERQLWASAGMVIDLDDPDVFNELWNGFTTGECFLSISGLKYQQKDLNLVITELMEEDLEKQELDVENEINITVNCDSDLPYAKVGKEFKLFTAKATSVHQLDLKVVSNVYYNYGTDSPISISIKDGKFTPEREGVYSIVYCAKDRYGNQEIKAIDIEAKDQDDLTIELINPISVADLGEEIQLVEKVEVKNNSGEIDYKFVIENNGKTYVVENENSFVPEYAGEYKVALICYDYLEQKVEEFTFVGNASSIVKMQTQPSIPNYMIKNATYELKPINAINYQSGKPVETSLELYVKEDQGVEERINGKYTVSASENVEIIYRLGDFSKSYMVKVVDIGYGSSFDVKKYFVANKQSATTSYDSGDSLIMSVQEDTSFEFVNIVSTIDFTFVFNGLANKSNFSNITIYLIDTITKERIAFTFVNNGGQAAMLINGGQEIKLKADFLGYSGQSFNLFFNGLSGIATPDNETFRTITQFESGKKFEGFTDNKAYFVVEFNEVRSASEIQLYILNKQALISMPRDMFAPNIYGTSVSGDRNIGDSITLEKVKALDVLDPTCNLSFVITTPNGTYYKDKSGNVFDGTAPCDATYKIDFTEIGEYYFEWLAEDGAGRSTTFSFGIEVVDNEAPVISLTEVSYSAKLNETFTLAKYSVKDNASNGSNIKVYVFVQDEALNMINVKNGTYKFTQKGIYRVIYYAMDEQGNAGCREYLVAVA